MPIVITKEKGVPRRMRGFYAEDEPRPKPNAKDFVHPDVDPTVETYAPVLDPEGEDLAPASEPSSVATPEASAAVVDAPAEETAQRTVSMGAMLTLPFFAYLTFSNRLPLWARVVSGALGAGLLVGEGGLLQRWSAKDAGEEPLFGGYRKRLRGYATPFGEVTFSTDRGLGDCGCGCGGKPGGCGG